MRIDALARRFDASNSQITGLRGHCRCCDPGDRGGLATRVAWLHDPLDELPTCENGVRAQQARLIEAQAGPEREQGEGTTSPASRGDAFRRVLKAAPEGSTVSEAEDHQPLRVLAEAPQCRYRRLFDSAADAIVLFGPDRRLAEANPASYDMLGYARHEIGQLRLDDLVACDAEQLGAIIASLRRDGAWRDELEIRRKDGAIVPVDAAIATLTSHDGVAFWAVFRDIADQRRRHDEVARARRDVAAMIGHELMNPLNGILLQAEVLKMTRRHRDASVDAIIASVQQQRRLIEDLVEFVRDGMRPVGLRRSRVDLPELCHSCMAGYQSTVGKHLVRIDAPARMPAGHWDRNRLEQVCHNLLSNAVKYSPDGGEILVRVEDLGDRARLSVADQGVGISADALPRVFDRFFRAHATDTGPRGLGLGLHIAKALVEAHGGTISAESEPGRGSVFRVTLPYEATDGAKSDQW